MRRARVTGSRIIDELVYFFFDGAFYFMNVAL
jgi:hypothetical protein